VTNDLSGIFGIEDERMLGVVVVKEKKGREKRRIKKWKERRICHVFEDCFEK
jgi:hypothetical protein